MSNAERALANVKDTLALAMEHDGARPAIIDGPFSETKELVAGYWIWQVKSMEEALEWARRCPDPMPGEEAELEIRPVYELEDFGAEFTPELRAREQRIQAEISKQAQQARKS